MQPTGETGRVFEVNSSSQHENVNDNTKPSKASLPISESRLQVAKEDLALSFKTIGSLLAAPFVGILDKSENKEELAQNIMWNILIPATAPAALLGAALMLPLAIISGVISFAAGQSTQKFAGGDYDTKKLNRIEDPEPKEYDEINSPDDIDTNPLINPEIKK